MTELDIEKKIFFEAHSKRFVYQERLKKGCANCGTKGQKYLQFHHREPREKLFDIAWGLGRQSISKEWFDVELEKCDVLCVVCHKRIHANGNLCGAFRATDRRLKKLGRMHNELHKKNIV